MSEENVQAFKRGFDAMNRRDIEGVLAVVHPEVEWHPGMSALLSGEATVYRGHAGVREWLRGVHEAFSEAHADFPDIRDLGDRLVAIGYLHASGRASGAQTDSPFAYLVEFKDGKVLRVRTYLDHSEALEAAGLSE